MLWSVDLERSYHMCIHMCLYPYMYICICYIYDIYVCYLFSDLNLGLTNLYIRNAHIRYITCSVKYTCAMQYLANRKVSNCNIGRDVGWTTRVLLYTGRLDIPFMYIIYICISIIIYSIYIAIYNILYMAPVQ